MSQAAAFSGFLVLFFYPFSKVQKIIDITFLKTLFVWYYLLLPQNCNVNALCNQCSHLTFKNGAPYQHVGHGSKY